MENKIIDTGERIGIGTSPPTTLFNIKIDEYSYLGFGSGIPSEKLMVVGKTNELVRPHGKNCGCELGYEYGIGLGCPNPTHKLNIK